MQNKEHILKLLKSEDKINNLIGLQLIRAEHLDNWGAFVNELYEMIRCEYYIVKDFRGNFHEKKLSHKYFDRSINQLGQYWYYQID